MPIQILLWCLPVLSRQKAPKLERGFRCLVLTNLQVSDLGFDEVAIRAGVLVKPPEALDTPKQ